MVNKKTKKIIIDKQNFNNIQMFNEDIEKYGNIKETILNFKKVFLFKGNVLDTKIFKKNLKQTETGKKMYIRLYELAKKENNKELIEFTSAILEVYEKIHINGHIEWEK